MRRFWPYGVLCVCVLVIIGVLVQGQRSSALDIAASPVASPTPHVYHAHGEALGGNPVEFDVELLSYERLAGNSSSTPPTVEYVLHLRITNRSATSEYLPLFTMLLIEEKYGALYSGDIVPHTDFPREALIPNLTYEIVLSYEVPEKAEGLRFVAYYHTPVRTEEIAKLS